MQILETKFGEVYLKEYVFPKNMTQHQNWPFVRLKQKRSEQIRLYFKVSVVCICMLTKVFCFQEIKRWELCLDRVPKDLYLWVDQVRQELLRRGLFETVPWHFLGLGRFSETPSSFHHLTWNIWNSWTASCTFFLFSLLFLKHQLRCFFHPSAKRISQVWIFEDMRFYAKMAAWYLGEKPGVFGSSMRFEHPKLARLISLFLLSLYLSIGTIWEIIEIWGNWKTASGLCRFINLLVHISRFGSVWDTVDSS